MKPQTIARFLNKELDVRSIKDASKNGLQVKNSIDITKIGFAVDACMDVFTKAKKAGCQMVICHHGLFWRETRKKMGDNAADTIDRTNKKRVSFLKKNNIAVYGCHLPLDIHKKYGNNVELLRMIGMKPRKIFDDVGWEGKYDKTVPLKDIIRKLNKELNTKVGVLPFGPSKIKRIAVVSGGGGMDVYEAIMKKMDLFITGDASHTLYHYAKENNLNVIFGGHYATEIVGVKALMPLLKEKYCVKTVFIESDTGY